MNTGTVSNIVDEVYARVAVDVGVWTTRDFDVLGVHLEVFWGSHHAESARSVPKQDSDFLHCGDTKNREE